jgi:hypothetical protein
VEPVRERAVEVETLEQPPSMGRLYATAALTARGRSGTGPLPGRALRLAGVRGDHERLLRYQHLCGFPVGDVLPHTWPQVLGFPLQTELMARRDFPLPLPGLVHLENAITVLRPLSADDDLELTVRAEHLREHPRGLLVDLVTEAAVAGEPAWTGRATYLRKGGSHDVARPGPAPASPGPSPTGCTAPPGRWPRSDRPPAAPRARTCGSASRCSCPAPSRSPSTAATGERSSPGCAAATPAPSTSC